LVDPDRTCVGCLRTLDEIARWSTATNQEKLSVLDAIVKRIEARQNPDQNGASEPKSRPAKPH